MSKDIREYLPYYIGQQAMTPDGIGAIVGLPWQIKSNDRVAIHFGKMVYTKNSIDGGYNKKRNYGEYLVAEKHYEAIATSDPDFDSFSMPGGVKPILRKLESMTEDELKAICLLFEFNAQEFYRQQDAVWARNRITSERLKITFDLSQYFGIHVWEEFTEESKKLMLPLDKTLRVFDYLLSCGFDLFNLINDSLAIDKATLK